MNDLENVTGGSYEFDFANGNYEELVADLVNEISALSPLVCIISALLTFFLAFFTYKIFKGCLALIGAVGGFFVGEALLTLFIGDAVVGVIGGIIFALLFAFIAVKFREYFIFAIETVSIFTICLPFILELIDLNSSSVVAFGDSYSPAVIAALIISLLLGAFVVRFFRPLYIISSSISLCISAAVYVVVALFGTGTDLMMLGIAAVAGVLLGIIPMIKQFKTTSDSDLRAY